MPLPFLISGTESEARHLMKRSSDPALGKEGTRKASCRRIISKAATPSDLESSDHFKTLRPKFWQIVGISDELFPAQADELDNPTTKIQEPKDTV
jgi:hypothetical protein